MGKEWDDIGGPGAFQAQVKLWGEGMLPLLYPGALVFMFGGTRMWHRLAAGMEDAGFHLWDTMMWLHGQGFPKGQDISKLIDKKNGDDREVLGRDPYYCAGRKKTFGDGEKYGTAQGGDEETAFVTAPGSEQSAPWVGHKTPQLKPAWEPILCFKAPTDERYVDLALKYGSGALNVDAGRIGDFKNTTPTGMGRLNSMLKDQGYRPSDYPKEYGDPEGGVGRYPANVILDETSAPILDEQTGTLKSGSFTGHRNTPKTKNVFGDFKPSEESPLVGSSGGASRFFYCAKASRSEREAGLDRTELKAFGMSNQAKAEIKRGSVDFENSGLGVNSVKLIHNNHPTVKPIDLTRWMASLLLPPSSVEPRRLLVPFSGSGSEMIGAMQAGWDEVIGVEMNADYCNIAENRINHWFWSRATGTEG